METPRPPRKEAPLGCQIATGVLVLLFGLWVVPPMCDGINHGLVSGQFSQTLNNERQIHLATLRMVTDTETAPDSKIGWPGDLPDVKTMSDFVALLVEHHYVDRGDLKPLFYGPGVKAYTGTGPFTSENSAYKIYKVTKADYSKVIFISTKNFTFGQPLDPKAVPFGNKGAVIFRKGGEGVIINDSQATRSAEGNIGFNVGGTFMESVGPPSVPLL